VRCYDRWGQAGVCSRREDRPGQLQVPHRLPLRFWQRFHADRRPGAPASRPTERSVDAPSVRLPPGAGGRADRTTVRHDLLL